MIQIRPSPAEEHVLELADRLMRLADLGRRMRLAELHLDVTWSIEPLNRLNELRREFDRMVGEVLDSGDGEGEREPTEDKR